MIYVILGLILFLYIIRRSNTSDLIKQANITTDEQIDQYNNAVLVIKSTEFSCLLLLAAFLSLLIIALIRHTSIELFFMNYFGTGIFREQVALPFTWYALPFFILIIRGIIIEVNIGDYIKKHYALTEEEISVKDAAKSILFKPKKTTTPEIETLDLEPTPVVTQPEQPQVINAVPQPVAPATPQSVADPVNQEEQNKNSNI